jgi:hypothetical protein
MRWSGDKIQPVGGWERIGLSAPASKIRAIHTWVSNNGLQMTAYLCEAHCYVDMGSDLVDITPVGGIEPPSDDLVAGGYGDNVYSFGDYGTPRPERVAISPITAGYYVDNWGQNLMVMTSTDGRLLEWDPSVVGGKLAAVPSAPVSNRGFLVTPQRHVVLFAAGGIANRFAWSGQENNQDWDFASVLSTAGFYEIQPFSPIVCGCKSGDDFVFFTASGDAFVVRYIGTPYIYQYEKIGSGIVPISPMSIRETPIGAVWCTFNGFWKYDAGSVTPVQCNVWNWMKDDVNPLAARYEAAMVPVDTFSELWFFFPDKESIENTKCVIWNYKEGWWSQARLGRSCGASSTYTTYPIMSDGVNYYRHESGYFYSAQDDDDLPWAKTFSIKANGGTTLSTFMEMLPDIEGNINGVSFRLEYNIPRSGTGAMASVTTDEKHVEADGFVKFRSTGRDFRVIVEQSQNGIGPWSVGECGFDLIPRGQR